MNLHKSRMAVFVFGLILAVGVACRADVVKLKNADRLSGQIQKLEQRSLSLETSYAGVVKIDWRMIEHISTDQPVEVELDSGVRVRGRIEESDQGLRIVSAEKAVTVARVAIVGMKPAKEARPETFWDQVQGTVDLGYSIARGNSNNSQSSLRISTRYRKPKYEVQASASSLFTSQSGAPTNSRQQASLRYDRFLSDDTFAFGLSRFERDDRRRLNLRSNFGGGLGWKIIRSGRTTLSLLGGLTFVNEQFRLQPGDPIPRNPSGEGLAALDWETTIASGLKLDTKLSVLPNFVQSGRYRVTLDSGVRIPLVSRLSWNLSLFNHYDSQPPLQVRRNDYGLVTGLGISF